MAPCSISFRIRTPQLITIVVLAVAVQKKNE